MYAVGNPILISFYFFLCPNNQTDPPMSVINIAANDIPVWTSGYKNNHHRKPWGLKLKKHYNWFSHRKN